MEFSLLQDFKDLFNNHYSEMEDTEKWLPPGLRYFQHLWFLFYPKHQIKSLWTHTFSSSASFYMKGKKEYRCEMPTNQ